MLVAILLALLALVARVDAAGTGDPAGDPTGDSVPDSIALALRYADVLTGEDPAAAEPSQLGDDDFSEDASDDISDHAADDALEEPTAGAPATLDSPTRPGDALTASAAASAGAAELYEQMLRHTRLSLWGRVDLGVSWRRRWSAPAHTPARRSDELLLLATWRR